MSLDSSESSISTPSPPPVIHVIGGGLAGCEAALQLAHHGVRVHLFDMKPHLKSPAHTSTNLAEIVCSNSFGSQGSGTASGLIKLEMGALGCQLIAIAQSMAVPAGKALAVDRDRFAQAVTDAVQKHPNIVFHSENVTEISPEADYTIVATGPLTSPELSKHLSTLLNREQLYFFDAASPIIEKESINMDIAFIQDRYANEKKADIPADSPEAGSETPESASSYINCPLNKPEYQNLVRFILEAEKTPLKEFEEATKTQFFESCLPVEVIASRGEDTLRYGPMKPVGLDDPRTGRWPYAAVQLRQDNAEGTLYNMVGFQTNIKWGPQKEMIRMIPGLENAEIVRYGVMHRNTYLHSPEVLQPTLQLKSRPDIFIAGQLTGTEGYTESIATGMMAALNIVRLIQEQSPVVLPPTTMLGSLLRYITRPEAVGKDFQPINSNWGVLPILDELKDAPKKIRKDKKNRNRLYVKRSLADLQQALTQWEMRIHHIPSDAELWPDLTPEKDPATV